MGVSSAHVRTRTHTYAHVGYLIPTLSENHAFITRLLGVMVMPIAAPQQKRLLCEYTRETKPQGLRNAAVTQRSSHTHATQAVCIGP